MKTGSSIIAAVATLAGLLSALPGGAQDEMAAAEEPAELYQVEVLVFRHVDQSRTSTEISRLAEPEIDEVLDQQLAKLAAPTPAETTAENTALVEEAGPFWQPAAPERRVMLEDAERLKRLDAYELVSHMAWIQAAEDVTLAEGIATAELDANPELSGSVKLYRKRYLHLAVDLTLGSDSSTGSRGGFEQFLPVRRVKPAIVDSRRMRLGRTVYFDQPEFGVLATVTRPTIDELQQAGLQDSARLSQ